MYMCILEAVVQKQNAILLAILNSVQFKLFLKTFCRKVWENSFTKRKRCQYSQQVMKQLQEEKMQLHIMWVFFSRRSKRLENSPHSGN